MRFGEPFGANATGTGGGAAGGGGSIFDDCGCGETARRGEAGDLGLVDTAVVVDIVASVLVADDLPFKVPVEGDDDMEETKECSTGAE